jgi:hypothetical protein
LTQLPELPSNSKELFDAYRDAIIEARKMEAAIKEEMKRKKRGQLTERQIQRLTSRPARNPSKGR